MTENHVVLRKDELKNEQELISTLIKRGNTELTPTFDKEGIRYPRVEEILKSGPNEVRLALKKLAKRGVLDARFVDRVLTCPNCSSSEVHNKYTCPKCSSFNVEYTQLLEHMKCGYMGPRDTFEKEITLVCPNCRTQLREEALDYRVIGNCFQCEKCNYRFDKPDNLHICGKCGRKFSYQDAKYVKVFAYRITDKTLADLGKDHVILESIKEIFETIGCNVQLHAGVVGISGVEHHFDVLAEREKIRIVIDISIAGAKNDMISLLGKKVDVNPTEAIIIDLSKSDELSQLGKVYNITVFKVANKYDLAKHFSLLLKDIHSTETSLSLAQAALEQVKLPAKEFYEAERTVAKETIAETVEKAELEEKLDLLEKEEKILHDYLRILKEKKAIQEREEEVKAKHKALEKLGSQVEVTN